MTVSRRVLITGGSGFLGHALVEKLLQTDAERICILSRGEYRQHLMRDRFRDDRLRWFVGDVRDRDRLRRAMHDIDVVIHAAALKRVEVGEYDPAEMVKTNVLGTVNVMEAAEDAGVNRLVLVSSGKAFQPANAYGASKMMAEKLILAGMRGDRRPLHAVCRYGNVSGSTGSVIPIWRRALEHGEVACMTDPEATRFWMTREQAADLVLDTARTMRGGELAVPDLPAYRLGDLAEAMGVRTRITGLGQGEKLHESMSEGRCSADARRMSVDELKEGLRAIPA